MYTEISTEGNAQSVYPVTADTLTAAVADADSRSSREVYLGQLRTVVFGKSLLADKAAFEAVLEELERGNALSEKVMVLGLRQCHDGDAAADPGAADDRCFLGHFPQRVRQPGYPAAPWAGDI